MNPDYPKQVSLIIKEMFHSISFSSEKDMNVTPNQIEDTNHSIKEDASIIKNPRYFLGSLREKCWKVNLLIKFIF